MPTRVTAMGTRLLPSKEDAGRTAAADGVLRLAEYACTYRELRLPVIPDGKGRFGRPDVVVRLPGVPDLVVEIDSCPSASSAQKPTFARDAGACPLWVRFGTDGRSRGRRARRARASAPRSSRAGRPT
ncbi:hypothetical protein ACFYNZ_25645 [Streptomyces kebangsaanensis]|uniref:Uncharacterized protein n=1 Tax=Streptomyces kebangsaanensis TaxID=864058 RepID=A0ABW6KY62_9ACTN